MNELPKAAKTLKEIRAVCRPQPLRGAALDAFWIDTGQARDRNRCLRERLREVLAEGDQRLLVYGHRGCGKSTELEKLVRDELGDRWFTVQFSVREDLPPVGVRAEDVLLVLAGQVLARATESGLPVSEKYLEPVLAYFNEVKVQVSKERSAGIECGSGVGTDGAPNLLGSLVKLFVDVRAQIKYNSRQQETIVSELRRTPSQLVHAVNEVLEAVRQSLPHGKRLLVIVEDLDKIGLADARDVFVLNHKLLSGITSAVIYTIPLFTFHSHEAAELRASFDGSFCLPMIKVDEPDGTRAEGFEVIREVVHRRIDPALIQSEALELLIAKTGGVLRHVFEVLSNVALLSTLRQPPIRKEHIRAELDHFKAELVTQISLPTWEKIPGVESIDQLRKTLCSYRKQRAAGKPCPVVADAPVRMLLQAEALIEYNGKGWLGVHPLVEEHLDEIGCS